MHKIKEFNLEKLTVSLERNRSGATQDQWVLLLGDSHSWGQGSPESQNYTTAGNVSVHSANIHNKGFMARLSEDICKRRGIHTATYGAWSASCPASGVRPGFYGGDALQRSANDPAKFFPLLPVVGKITGALAPLSSYGALTDSRFYSPAAVGAPYTALFREKLAAGLFGLPLLTLTTEGVSEFQESGKTEYLQLTVNPARPASGAGFATYTNGAGGIYVERNTTTNDLYLSTAQTVGSLPSWVVAGALAFLPGYGLIRFATVTGISGGTTLGVSTVAGGALGGTPAFSCIRDGMRLYHPAYVQKCVVRVPMQAPARALYIAVRHKPGGGMLNIYFTDNLGTGGGGNDPYLTGGVARLTANDFEWSAAAGVGTTVAGPNGVLTASAKACVTSVSYQIDTSAGATGAVEEIVYRVDFGATQLGDLFIEASGSCDIRGVILDNNKVANLAMGGHTIGGWLGTEASYSNETGDHIGQILNHTPVQPSHVIVQLPLVNEYFRQTPIATFVANLTQLVSRFRAHIPGSNNFNAKGVDFLFFTTLKSRPEAWGGETQPSITYDMYIQVARAVCASIGCAFVDVESVLSDMVRAGRIDYQRLYNDDGHPSDYANELIYEEIKKVLAVMV
jgi:lysophospholipase L1-like esterase